MEERASSTSYKSSHSRKIKPLKRCKAYFSVLQNKKICVVISLEEFKIELNGFLASQDVAQLIICFLGFLYRLSLEAGKTCMINVPHLLQEVDYEYFLKSLANLPRPNRMQIEKLKASLLGLMTSG